MTEDTRGDSAITIHLRGVDEREIPDLLEALADVLSERGLGTATGDDADIRSLIAVAATPFPSDEESLTRLARSASQVVLPGPGPDRAAEARDE